MAKKITYTQKKNAIQLSLDFGREDSLNSAIERQVKVISFSDKIKEKADIARDKIFRDVLNNSKSF